MLENRPDAIIHCAAKVGGVKANSDYPVDFILDNLEIQNSVIKAAFMAEVPIFVNVGTSCLYPREAPVPVKEEYLLTGPFDPSVEAYAIAKLAGHALIKAYRKQYGCSTFFTVAPCNLYGYNDNYGPSAHVIPGLMARLTEAEARGGHMTVWGDGSAIREFMFADDAASAIMHAIKNYFIPPELLNIGTGIGTSIGQLVGLICDAAGYQPFIKWDSSKPTGIQEKTFDISKLSDLGWKPSVSLPDGIKATWDEFNRNPSPRFK